MGKGKKRDTERGTEEGKGTQLEMEAGLRITGEPTERRGKKAYSEFVQDLHRAMLSNKESFQKLTSEWPFLLCFKSWNNYFDLSNETLYVWVSCTLNVINVLMRDLC